MILFPPFSYLCFVYSSIFSSYRASLIVGKEFTFNAGDPGLIPGLGRSGRDGIGYSLQNSWASLVAQLVKNLLAMWETWVRSLDWENPLEKKVSLLIPVFWPGEFHRLYSPWDPKGLDTIE